jgi:hypothetical protein
MSDPTPEQFEAYLKTAREALRRFRAEYAGKEHPVAYSQSRHTMLDEALIFVLALAVEFKGRIAALEQRAAEPSMKYMGAYKAEQEYTPGSTVSHGGQLWHCNRTTTDRPGDNSEAWTLCSRRGRDGKDLDAQTLVRLVEQAVDQALSSRGVTR